MLHSFRYSQLSLRIGLAFVFLWFGIDKFIHPSYWINAWVPLSVQGGLVRVYLSATDFIYINGIFEVLVGTSILSAIFVRVFAFLAVIFLLVVLVMNGFNEVMVRDIGLIGALSALIFWPQRNL